MLDAAPRIDATRARQDELRRGQNQAAVAARLLVQPELGITSVTYVGLPERQGVHLTATAHDRGLRPILTREDAGTASITIRPGLLTRILSDF
jgi:hypothetical protein